MASDRFYISAFAKNSGLYNAVKPFAVPDKAFAILNNAYVWRDRVRKRFGSRWLGNTQQETRLRINVGTTSAVTGNLGATIMPGTKWQIGQIFSIGTTIFTVWQANGALKSTGTATGTYNTANGSLVITGNNTNPLTSVYFYPAQPVMGLITFETQTINDEQTIAFDTQFAYQYINGWERIAAENAPGDAIWTGSDSQFFWGASYGGVSPSDYTLYVTNFNENEPNFMRYMQSVAGTFTWFSFRPTIALTTSGSTLNIYLRSARILVPFKNRLLAFNTWEAQDAGAGVTLVHYPFRVRWSSANADTTDQVLNWRQDIPGRGNGRDCPTLEAIITVEFIRDRLIVYLERSTWELVYTGNEIYPFDWQQINTELGAESTFSVVPFDTVALGVGNVGIVACSGTNVERIDNNIPDEVFKIHNDNDGIERVYGIRDYYPELVYWTMPDPTASTTFPYPKKVLVYNYKNSTWSFNDDSITAFGYFQPVNSVTWDSEEVTWDDEEQWDDGSIQSQFRSVIAGNQQGWTFLIDTEAWTNAPALQITNITTPIPGVNIIDVRCINFNLESGDYIYLSGITGTTNMNLLNGTIQRVEIDLTNNIDFSFIVGDDAIPPITGVYTGGGTISRVSNIEIQTKAFNFYQQKGKNAAINKVDFLVDRTTTGQILIDWYVSNSTNAMVRQSQNVTGTGVLLGTSVLETFPYTSVPLEATQSQLWHPVYISANGEYVQLYLHMNNEQMRNNAVRISDFQLHAMVFTTTPTSRLQ